MRGATCRGTCGAGVHTPTDGRHSVVGSENTKSFKLSRYSVQLHVFKLFKDSAAYPEM